MTEYLAFRSARARTCFLMQQTNKNEKNAITKQKSTDCYYFPH